MDDRGVTRELGLSPTTPVVVLEPVVGWHPNVVCSERFDVPGVGRPADHLVVGADPVLAVVPVDEAGPSPANSSAALKV
jgi:hypothetical protein